jgi:hypothetical protein
MRIRLDLDDDTTKRLVEVALAERRSASDQAQVLLEEWLGVRPKMEGSTGDAKDHVWAFHVDATLLARLDALVSALGVKNRAAVVRWLIEHAEYTGQPDLRVAAAPREQAPA